jgi:hypothetical protein
MPTKIAVKRKADGSVSINSKSDVRAALDRLEAIEREILDRTHDLVEERADLKVAVEHYVINKFEAGAGYEDDTWLATKVVGHTRTWDVDKLSKIIPRGILKNVTELKVLPAKLDAAVRAGKIDRTKIKAAFTETPNKPYVKITRRVQDDNRASDEAESLAAKLA